jgi:hypothetical protein
MLSNAFNTEGVYWLIFYTLPGISSMKRDNYINNTYKYSHFFKNTHHTSLAVQIELTTLRIIMTSSSEKETASVV